MPPDCHDDRLAFVTTRKRDYVIPVLALDAHWRVIAVTE